MKKIYFDLETTSTNPVEASILEATFLFVENQKIVKVISSKINFNPSVFALLSDLEVETLKFNNINNLEELENHNKQAVYFKSFFDEILEYLTGFNNNGHRFALTGWNNSGFDNVILRKFLQKTFGIYFDYHARDIMHDFRRLKELDFFKNDNLKSLRLSEVHKNIIGSISEKDFHKSYFDCLAVKDLDEWYEKNILIGGAK